VRMWLTPQEVGLMTGFSATFIRTEIKLKALPAQWVISRSQKTGRWRIHRDDAVAYAIKLGTWRSVPSS
jgi:hypothetical protein